MRKPFNSVCLAIIYIVFGLAVVFIGTRDASRGKQSESWPTTEGVITSASIRQRVVRATTKYIPEVSYTYTVEDTRHSGSRIQFGSPSSRFRNSAERVLDRFRPGSTVPVSYNSKDHAESVLKPGVRSIDWLFILVGLGSTCIGLFMIISKVWAFLNR